MLIKELLHFNLLEINILNSLKNKNEVEIEFAVVGFLFTKGLRGWETSPSPSQGGEHELGASS